MHPRTRGGVSVTHATDGDVDDLCWANLPYVLTVGMRERETERERERGNLQNHLTLSQSPSLCPSELTGSIAQNYSLTIIIIIIIIRATTPLQSYIVVL